MWKRLYNCFPSIPTKNDAVMNKKELQRKADALPRNQRRVLELLLLGGKHSVADICCKLFLSDPRGYIRVLRDKGFEILDEWRVTDFGNRYKVYFIKTEAL